MTRFQKFHLQLKKLGYDSYNEYLQSDHWKELRVRYYQSKCYKNCLVCKKPPVYPNFHHRTYKRLGKERLGDIVLVCRVCHKLIHDTFNTKFFKNKKRTDLWRVTKFVARRSIRNYRKIGGQTTRQMQI